MARIIHDMFGISKLLLLEYSYLIFSLLLIKLLLYVYVLYLSAMSVIHKTYGNIYDDPYLCILCTHGHDCVN